MRFLNVFAFLFCSAYGIYYLVQFLKTNNPSWLILVGLQIVLAAINIPFIFKN